MSSQRVAAEAAASTYCDLDDVKGHMHVKRALEIAAAGGHSILLVGPPGSGKTMLARSLAGLLPSVEGGGCRPFREPTPWIHPAALAGGPDNPSSEMALARNGVLFLDRLHAYRRQALERLRTCLEDATPSPLLLVATMSPCPCGYRIGSRPCTCSARAIRRHLSRLPDQLASRFDLHLEVPQLRPRDLMDHRAGESSAAVQKRVEWAREVQECRFADRPDIGCNARMRSRDFAAFCRVGKGSEELLRTAIIRLEVSARSFYRTLAIARTIADLAGEPRVGTEHVAEAISYRALKALGA